MSPRINLSRHPVRRRGLLQIGSAGALGLALPSILRWESQAAPNTRSSPQARSVILVWLSGGPATIDMWDLKPDAPENIRGEFQAIPSNVEGCRISEHLPKMATVMDRVTLVRSLAHTIP